MPSLGPAEVLVILVIALLVFGPNKMPELARQAGNAFRELRRAQQHLKSEISGAVSDLQASGTGSDAGPDDGSDAGGDPVPMLPPLDATAMDAVTNDMNGGPSTEAGTAPPAPPAPPARPEPSSPPPADPA